MPFVFFENVISNVVLQVHGSWFCMFSQWVFAARNLTSNIKQLSPWFCMPSTSYYLRTGSSLHLIEAQYESKHSFSGSGASTSSWRSSKIGHYWDTHTHTHTRTHTHTKKSHTSHQWVNELIYSTKITCWWCSSHPHPVTFRLQHTHRTWADHDLVTQRFHNAGSHGDGWRSPNKYTSLWHLWDRSHFLLRYKCLNTSTLFSLF